MTDITNLLQGVAPAISAPSRETVDNDLARGRAALIRARRRQAVRRGSTAGLSLAAVAAVGVLIADSSSGTAKRSTHAQVTPTVAHSSTTHHRTTQISVPSGTAQVALVAYTGAQLPGFTVDRVPDGWHLSTSSSDALLITRDGSTDNDPDAFAGKLAVLTSSVDEHGLGDGDAVTVDGQPGRVSVQGDTQILRYNAPNGFGIDIQAPTALGWSDQEIVSFAQGVDVTANAVHSEG